MWELEGQVLAGMLSRMVRVGRLRVYDADGRFREFAGQPGPVAAIRLGDRALRRRLLWNPELALGEAYMEGTLTCEDGTTLRDFLTLLFVNPALPDTFDRWCRRLEGWWRHLASWSPGFALNLARRNVAHHYDLSRRLFELFLDEDLQYSCACFEAEGEGLEAAQQHKRELIARKLCLRPGIRVLDIGSGWGGLALHLGRHAGVQVTGITLSVEQFQVATERARLAGLSDRVRFALMDYRETTGCYDRIVSVGMFEHVGVRHYDQFFSLVRGHLAGDGIALLHSIGRSAPPGGVSPWLHKYIFPDGYSPSLSEVLAAVERQALWVTDVEILRQHYARTLVEWQRRFQQNRERIRALYDERFCRMWELYLMSCELVFRLGCGMVFQMQLARHSAAVPLTRQYLWQEPQAEILHIPKHAADRASDHPGRRPARDKRPGVPRPDREPPSHREPPSLKPAQPFGTPPFRGQAGDGENDQPQAHRP